jgi:undecaprenyl-diphosphatase
MPAQAWRRWLLSLVLGYACAGGAAVLAVALTRRWVDHGLQAWDERVLRALADSSFSVPQGLWFEAWGSSAFLVPMLVIAVVLLARAGHLFRALTLLVAYVLNKGLVLGAWQLWDRARPELVAAGIAAPGLHSFPSGHAVNAVVLFGLIGAMWWRASRSVVERALIVPVVGAVVLLTCIGRVRLGTHWPSDIVAGLAIGSIWLAGLIVAVALAERSGSAPRSDGVIGGGREPVA